MSLATDVSVYLKTIFADGYEDEALRIHTLLDKLSKPDIVGLNYSYVVKVGNSQNIAVGDDNLAAAQAVGSSSISRNLIFAPSYMSGEAVMPVSQLEMSLRGSTYSFGSLIETEVDGTMDEFYNRRGFQIYRDGTSNRGQISAISTNVLTITNTYDVVNLPQKMILKASANPDGSSPRTGSMTVTAADIDGGTITVDNAAGITGLAANDYLFATTEIGQLGLQGLSLCTPATAPVFGSDSFRGIDRGIDAVRLAGSRLTSAQATGTIEANVIKLIAKIRLVNGKSNFAAMNSDHAAEVRTRLGAKVRYEGGGGDATYGFSTFMFDTPGGPVTVYDDPDCPATGAWVGNSASHELATLDSLVRIDESDGNWAYKKPSNDQIGVRIRSVGQYLQRRPVDFGYLPIG